MFLHPLTPGICIMVEVVLTVNDGNIEESGDVMVESMALKEPGGVAGVQLLSTEMRDAAVISSSRRDLFRVRSRSRWDSPPVESLARVCIFFEEGLSPQISLTSNFNVSNAFGQAYSRCCTPSP